MQLRLRMAYCLAAFLAFAGTASADVAVSTSNRATAEIDTGLPDEQVAMAAMAAYRVQRFQSEPDVAAAGKAAPNLRYTRDFLRELPAAKGDAQWRCLAEALYFEARGESVKGQFAVAEVILNRVSSQRFPDTVCGVVTEGTGKRYQCQFTYTCDGAKEIIQERAAWTRAGKIARLMLDGAPRQLTAGATFYHTKVVNPRWSNKFARTATIGMHYFYRRPIRTASNG